MGCATSRIEAGEQMPLGVLPFIRRLQDLRRMKTDVSRHATRERKDSIVSTTELLRPEERDIDYYDAAAMEASVEKDESLRKGSESSPLLEIVKEGEEEKAEAAEERRIGFGRESPAEEELPGSPSFRFYCIDQFQRADTDEGSVQSPSSDSLNRIEEKQLEEKDLLEEKEDPNVCLVAGEGSGCKTIKRGRKFMSLPKGNFLNVRGCYNMNCSVHAQEGTRN